MAQIIFLKDKKYAKRKKPMPPGRKYKRIACVILALWSIHIAATIYWAFFS